MKILSFPLAFLLVISLLRCGSDEVSACASIALNSIVEDFQLVSGQDSEPTGFVADAAGNLFVSGSATGSDGKLHWLVRKSTDQAKSWTTVDDFQLVAGLDATPTLGSLTADPAGNLYVAGYAKDATFTRWIVRKSGDGGSSWSTIDSFLFGAPQPSVARSVAVDASGSLFVAGYAVDPTFRTHWLVRKSTDGGVSWSVVDDFQYAGASAEALHVTIDPLGAFFVVGRGNDTGKNHWLVRRSNDGAVSWTTVDDFFPEGTNGTSAYRLLVDGDSRIVVGNAESSGRHWIARKGTADGSSWTTVDDFQFTPEKASEGTALVRDGAGNLYSGGFAEDVNGTQRAMIRRSSDGGATWSAFSSPLYVEGKDSVVTHLGADSAGRLYVLKSSKDSNSKKHWRLRRYSCG